MLGGEFVLTQSPALSSSKQERWSETEEFRKPWQNSAACILIRWEFQTEQSFCIVKHMEVIYIVSLMCYFKQPVSLFPSWCFNQCSLRETAIHHHNGCVDAVNVNLKGQYNNTRFYVFPLLRNNHKLCFKKVSITEEVQRRVFEIMHILEGCNKLLRTRRSILIDRCVFK